MYGWTARDIRNAPRRCTPITASQSSTDILCSMLSRMMPALFTRTVGAPSSEAIRSTAAPHLGLIGHVRADGDGGSAGSADLVDHRLAGSGVQVRTATDIPSAASFFATTALIPRAHP